MLHTTPRHSRPRGRGQSRCVNPIPGHATPAHSRRGLVNRGSPVRVRSPAFVIWLSRAVFTTLAGTVARAAKAGCKHAGSRDALASLKLEYRATAGSSRVGQRKGARADDDVALASTGVRVSTPSGTSAIVTKDHYKFTPTVAAVNPSGGPTDGTMSVTVTGTGFGPGTMATVFKFGTAKATSVSCTSSTTCTMVAPAHTAGKVDVIATVNKVSSPKNAPTDQYTYS